MRTLKNLLKDAKDLYLALMSYRATRLPWCYLSPNQLLMGRRITVVPEADGVLVPSWPNLTEFRKVDEQHKKKQKPINYDKRHRTREFPEFEDNTEVFIIDE